MEGRGVTNYSTDKPSYGFSTATTEFDDALISRGIVTFEQAMLAKGATPTEALRLRELHEREERESDTNSCLDKQVGDGNDSLWDNSIEDDDEKFMNKYRQMSLEEIKSKET
jgi:hypothetical protein